MNIELRHLQCFVVLADELHFGRAAARLSMTQPPLSVNIRRLEERIGTRLFDRDSKGVRLTAAGEAFRGHAQALLARLDEACQLARDVGDGAVGRLRVGIVGLLLYRGLPQWLHDFGRSHPGIEVCVIELNSREQLEMLPRGELDIGFVLGRHIPEMLTAREVFTEPFVACLPQSHPACSRPSIRVADLRDEPFVLFSRRVSPDYYAQVVDVCVEAGFYPRVRHEPRHWLSVVALVSQGVGVAIVPAPLQRAGMAGVVFKPLEVPTTAVSTVQCVWSPGIETPAQQAFLQQILENSELAGSAAGGAAAG
jgi:DNA-binding transcriptional LysR family regulator